MSRKFAVEASLPEALRVPFQVLVHDYTIAAKARSDAGIPNYEILAELVRAGWRKSRLDVSSELPVASTIIGAS